MHRSAILLLVLALLVSSIVVACGPSAGTAERPVNQAEELNEQNWYDEATDEPDKPATELEPYMQGSYDQPKTSPGPGESDVPLFEEPAERPEGLPESVVWNPNTGTWYDSAFMTLNPISQTYQAKQGMTYPLPSGYVRPTGDDAKWLFKEPERPADLPYAARWNARVGVWYDSSPKAREWDPSKQTYVARMIEPPEDCILEKFVKTRLDEWIDQYKNSTDEIYVALIEYVKAMEGYLDEHPEYMLRSDWVVGEEEGGPLTIITDLGVAGVPRLLELLQPGHPLDINIKIAIREILRSRFEGGNTGNSDMVSLWKRNLYATASASYAEVENIVTSLASGGSPEKADIGENLNYFGVLALPAFYDAIIKGTNTSLIDYIYYVLPNERLTAYGISEETTDKNLLKSALASCEADVEIIRNLSAN